MLVVGFAVTFLPSLRDSIDLRKSPPLFSDPFTSLAWPYGYATKDGIWIVYSPSEDRRYDCNPVDLLTTDTTTTLERLAPYTYDPTNGKISSGSRRLPLCRLP